MASDDKSVLLDNIISKLFDCEQLLNNVSGKTFIDLYALKRVIQAAITVADACKYNIIGVNDER